MSFDKVCSKGNALQGRQEAALKTTSTKENRMMQLKVFHYFVVFFCCPSPPGCCCRMVGVLGERNNQRECMFPRRSVADWLHRGLGSATVIGWLTVCVVVVGCRGSNLLHWLNVTLTRWIFTILIEAMFRSMVFPLPAATAEVFFSTGKGQPYFLY